VVLQWHYNGVTCSEDCRSTLRSADCPLVHLCVCVCVCVCMCLCVYVCVCVSVYVHPMTYSAARLLQAQSDLQHLRVKRLDLGNEEHAVNGSTYVI
jgi:hypothetical protein